MRKRCNAGMESMMKNYLCRRNNTPSYHHIKNFDECRMRKQYKERRKAIFFLSEYNWILWWEILFLCPISKQTEWLRRMMWKFTSSNWLWLCAVHHLTQNVMQLLSFVLFKWQLFFLPASVHRKVFSFVIVIMGKASNKNGHFVNCFYNFFSRIFSQSVQDKEFHQKMYGTLFHFTNFFHCFRPSSG